MAEKIQAIRYIIYRVAQEFNIFNNQDKNNTEFFNENNNFTLDKCLMLPYIVTIANGKKEFFLEGIFQNAFLPLIDESWVKVGNGDNEKFEQITIEELNLVFNDKGFLVIDFQNLELYSIEESDLKSCIDYSVQFFKENRYPDFAILSEFTLKKVTSQNSAFEAFKQIAKSDDRKYFDSDTELFNIIALNSFYFLSDNKQTKNTVSRLALQTT